MNKLLKIARKFEIRLAQQLTQQQAHKPGKVLVTDEVTIRPRENFKNLPDETGWEEAGQGGQAGGSNQSGQAGQGGGHGGQAGGQGGRQEAGSGKAAVEGNAKSPQEVLQQAGWKNWKPKIYYTPSSPKDKDILLQKGYKQFPGIGLVPPNEIQFVTNALAKGWKYAGGGYGLVPVEWYNYLTKLKYI